MKQEEEEDIAETNLVPNLLPGFSNEQRLRLQHRKINLLKPEYPRNLNSTANQIQTFMHTSVNIYMFWNPNLSEILKEPTAEAHFLGGEVPGSLGRIDVDLLHHIGDRRRR